MRFLPGILRRGSGIPVALALVALTVAALGAGRLRRREMSIPKPATGVFPNGMAYARWGTGPRTLLMIPGGPGNALPSGMELRIYQRAGRALVEDGYTAWLVARKRNMPNGHSIADMADDYAQLIADEFGGKADVVLGGSYGGAIGFYLAARHPDRFGHIGIVVAAYTVSERGKAADYEYARKLSEGRSGEALAGLLPVVYPRLRVPAVNRALGALMARVELRETHPYFRNDVMVEAEAEVAFNAREILPDISVPVLLVCGDRDEYFPREVCEETALLIPDCAFTLYEGRDHLGVISDRRLPQDVLDFVNRDLPVRPCGGPS